MHIEFLYFEDCPSHEKALERLREVMSAEEIEAPVHVIKVETESQAQQLRFPGSPTILIDEKDIVSPESGDVYGLSCRAYQLEDGRISPLPSAAMLRAALRQARTEQER